MNKLFIVAAAFAASTSAFAQFASATNTWTGALGVKEHRTTPDAVTAYDNTVNFTGFASTSGAVGPANGSTGTFMDADDIIVLGSEKGKPVSAFTFSGANSNSVAVTASPTVVFWTDNLVSPGTVLAKVRFNPITIGALSVSLFSFTGTTPIFTVPTSGHLWMGVSWDDFSDVTDTGISDSQLALLGQGIFDPPVVGSSDDIFWSSDNFGNNAINNPAGGLFDFGQNPIASFGNSLTTVPEPASMAVLGLGALGLLRRRKTTK